MRYMATYLRYYEIFTVRKYSYSSSFSYGSCLKQQLFELLQLYVTN